MGRESRGREGGCQGKEEKEILGYCFWALWCQDGVDVVGRAGGAVDGRRERIEGRHASGGQPMTVGEEGDEQEEEREEGGEEGGEEEHGCLYCIWGVSLFGVREAARRVHEAIFDDLRM